MTSQKTRLNSLGIDQNLFNFHKNYEIILYKMCHSIYHKTIVVSNAVKNKYPDNKKINLIYSGIDINKFVYNEENRIMKSKELNINNKIVIGYFGILSKEKGADFLINNFIKLKKRYSTLHLLLIGKFSDSDSDKTKVMNYYLV